MKQWFKKRSAPPVQEQAAYETEPPSSVSNQAMLSMMESQSVQALPRPASGGTPLAEAMRAKFERQFGLPMGDVRIHRNSDDPAKFDAGAYTYGSDIFIGPGQENLLDHEMTHVAQQMMGQVRPTGMEHGMAINRSPALEHSADLGTVPQMTGSAIGPVVQCGGGCSKVMIPDDDKEEIEEAKYEADDRRQQEALHPTETLNSAELNEDEQKLFTHENFKGASMSEGKVGSIYFGGTSLNELDVDDKLKEQIQSSANQYLKNREDYSSCLKGKGSEDVLNEKKINMESSKYDLIDTLTPHLEKIERGGRARFTHVSGPAVSTHEHILRIGDTREGTIGQLLEIFFDPNEDGQLHRGTHVSRGTLVTGTDGEDEGEQESVRQIRELPDDVFQYLAQQAKLAHQHYASNGKTEDAATQANLSFLGSLQDDVKRTIPMHTP